MADLPPCNSMAQGDLLDAAGNNGGGADSHHPHVEGNIFDEQTTTPSTSGIPTPLSIADSAGKTGPPVSEDPEDVSDSFVELDGQPRGLLIAGATLAATSAPVSSQEPVLVDDDVSSLEIASNPGWIHTGLAKSSSSGDELVSSRSALLSSSDDEHGGDHEYGHGEILMAFVENDRHGLPSRLHAPNNVSRRAVIMAVVAAVAVHGTVSPPYPYRTEIEETLEELL
ncbi:hypothetical protein B0T21DRAFT_165854 [Apiosordaria backusii]|uniref:Uncharacterized protein n=1 Tax=Apiosordaria backusii TaxID=314023 RepID=A0AA40EIB3_9PEZI|nr:hypothetical protein B0T21DRAFT_165854 [Apiosordaria backusii]